MLHKKLPGAIKLFQRTSKKTSVTLNFRLFGRMIIRTLVVLLPLVFTVLAYGDGHPMFYIDKGACPFECCKYGEWHVEKTTKLHTEPKAGSLLAGVAETGTLVRAETGEVHTKPGKFIVKHDITSFKKGEVLWIYTYLGEGFFKVWYGGKFREEEIGIDYHNPGSNDWGYFKIKPDSMWWIKIKTPKGIVGWTNQPENFSNKDACG